MAQHVALESRNGLRSLCAPDGETGLWGNPGVKVRMWHRFNTFYSPEKHKWGLTAQSKAQVGKKIRSLLSCHTLNLTGFKINFWKLLWYCIFCKSLRLGPENTNFCGLLFFLLVHQLLLIPQEYLCFHWREIPPCSLSPKLLFLIFYKNIFLKKF